jgi:glyoxylase-like metal-dependent hydrolase (beta-lactamase superfamily II)
MRQIVSGLWEIDEIGSAVHCYLWEWDGSVTLIDSGFPRDGKKVLSSLVARGYPLHSVKRIIVTHVDLDHTGGLPAVKRATGASVVCHAVEKEFLERPGRRKMASPLIQIPWALTGLAPGLRQQSVSPDELVVDGQMLPEGFLVIHTPGHTPGHISLLHRESRLLIAGDALSNRRGRMAGPLSIFTPDGANAQRSIWKLAKKYGDDFETIVFGHGPPVMANGGKRVRALASKIFASEV